MKMRMYTLPKRLIAMLLSIVLVLSVMPSLNATAKVVENSATADPSSMGTWQDAFMPNGMPSTEHAGGIWTDKSVFTQAGVEAAFDGLNLTVGKDNFLVALSALGSNSIVVGQGTQPTDTVFVLDISGSMDNTAMSAMVTAANNAIRTLMENDDNRVGVVLYSSANKVTTLLPLDHYTGVNMYGYGVEHYFTYSSSGDEISTYIQSSAPSDGGGGCGGDDDQPSQQAAYAYPVGQKNGEIKFGGNDRDAKDPIKCEGGTYIQGGLWEAWENNFKDASDTDNRTPSIVLMSDGAPTYTTNQFDAVPNNNTHGAGDDSYIGDGFVTQLTAAVVKELIDAKYPDAPAYMYTVGFGIDDIDNDDEKAIAAAVLDPTGSAHTDINDLWDTYGKLGPNGTMTVRLGSGNGTSSATVTKSATAVTSQYVDKYFSADSSSDLNDAFQNIVNEISLQAGYYPTRTDDNGTNYSGYVTFSDTIGSGMEVENVKGILVGDELYTGRDMAYVIWATDQNNNYGGNYSITLGTKDNPTALGDEFVRAVKARFGITAATTEEANNIAWELIGNAWKNGQLRYDPDTEEFSNYIGWYGDANGDYVAPYPSATVPANAEYINFCYGMLGTTTATSLASDMMYITVQVSQKIATQEQMVTFQIPASLLPVITYKIDVELETDGSIKENTAKISSTTANPVQLLYEVGVNEELVNELTIKDYGKPTGNGRYYLYTNAWDIDADGSLENPASNNYTYAYFEPSHDNQHYYFTEDTLIYADQNGTLYNGAAAPTGPVYYKHTVYHATGTPTDGKYSATVDTEYVQIVGDALASAKRNTDGTWYIPEDTMHANTHSHDLYKTNAPAGDKNHLGNLTETYNMVRNQIVDAAVSREAGTHHYELMYLGNNGRLTYAGSQGISLTKNVDATITDANAQYTFDIALADAGDAPVSGTYTLKRGTETTDITFAAGKASVTLKAGETVYIYGMPAGTKYTVTEQYGDAYQVSAGNGTGTIAENTLSEVVFTNTARGTGNLIIGKDVDNHPFTAEELASKKFSFTLTLTRENNTPYANQPLTVNASGTYATDANGVVTFELADNQSITVSNLPAGVTYTVTEAEAEGYTTTSTGETGTIVSGQSAQAHFVNSYKDPAAVSTNLQVEINKTLATTDATLGDTPFYFLIQRLNKEGTDYDVNVVEDIVVSSTKTNGTEIVDLSSLTFDQVGTYTYRITEFVPDGTTAVQGNVVPAVINGMTYDTTRHTFTVVVTDPDRNGNLVAAVDPSSAVNGSFEAGAAKPTFVANFENTYDVASTSVSFDIKKELENVSGVEIPMSSFRFGLYKDEDCTQLAELPHNTFTPGPRGNVDVTIHVGSAEPVAYYLKEIVPEENEKIPGMTYDNTVYKVIITAEQVDTSLQANVALETVTGTSTPTAGTATTDPVANFKNTYTVKATTPDIVLSGTKTIEGRDWLDTDAFIIDLFKTDASFVLANNATAEESRTVNKSAKTFAFTGLSFNKVGTYHYIIKERIPTDAVNNRKDGMTYDTTEYHVTVEVTLQANSDQLVAKTTVIKFGNGAVEGNKLDFTNTYAAAPTAGVTLSGTKTLVNATPTLGDALPNIALAGGEFSFTLEIKDPANVVVNTQTVSNGANGAYAFAPVSFDKAGNYTYTITEVNGGKSYITYAKPEPGTIVVTDNGTGQLVVTGGNTVTVDIENTYKAAETTLPLTAHKHLDGRPMVSGEFNFTLEARNGAPMPADYDVQHGVANGYRGLINFGKITYTKVGTYQYTIEETAGDDDIGVTYDPAEYTITVTVIDNGEGALEAAITKVETDTAGLIGDKEIQFYNTYKADKVTVNLTGDNDADGIKNLTDLSSTTDKTLDDFVLEFILKAEDGTEIETVQDNGSGFNFADITYDAPTTVVYWIEEVAGDIPGMTYDATKYKVTVTVTDNLTGKLVADVVYEKVTDAGTAPASKVEFNNTYKAKETTVTFQGLKTFEGGRDLKENEFSFTLAALNGAPMGVTGSTETVKNAADGKFTFSAITFTEEGEYAYELTEVKGDDKQVTYDPAKYTLTVTVTDVNGELKATTVVTKDNKSAEDYGFTNVFAPSSASVDIAVQKVLKNESGKEMGLKGFKFRLVGVEKTGTATAESNDKGEAKFTLTFTAEDIGKTFTYKLSEVDTEVADVTYDETVYEIKVAVGQNKTTGELILTVTSNGKVMEKAAEFVNTYAPAPEKEPEKEPEKDPEKTPEKDPDESPKTMDDFRIGNWLLMMSVGAVCLLAVIVLGKKKFEI